jgi:hypothetical protein
LRIDSHRRGVASVIGTVVFVLVFMMALGSMAYTTGVQEQALASQQQAQQAAARRLVEDLTFSIGASGPVATDDGPTTVFVNHIVLKFPNGTVYPLAASSSVSAGGSVLVQAMVPGGVCSPGTATCLSKYKQIASGNPPGSSVGVVTSMGNSFWYVYSANKVNWNSLTGFPKACAAGKAVNQLNTTLTCLSVGSITSWAKASVTTSGTGRYSSTGLAVTLPANASYAFYVFTAIEPSFGVESYDFEVHALPAGATLIIACSPMAHPTGGGNQPTNCVTSAGTPVAAPGNLGFGVSPPVYATPGLFGVVSLGGTGGTLQIDFACTANCGGVTLKAGSFMLVQPLG